jgi:hypothetical protein
MADGPSGERLDEDKLDLLRTWGEGLRDDVREEIRAAGRAITLLVEEIERLNVEIWHARMGWQTAPAAPEVAEALTEPEREPEPELEPRPLTRRLRFS